MSEIFTPVKSGRISAQIVDQIQDAIREGALEPGDRLPPERDLADRFGVSRVTVRDALRTLEVLGLVEIRVGAAGGAFVRAPDAGIVGEGMSNLLLTSTISPEEVAEARLILELGTVAMATVRASDDDIAELRDFCAEAQRQLDAGTYEPVASSSFHIRLARIARNKAVDVLVESIRGPLSMHRLRSREPQEKSHRATLEQHLAIVEAMAKRDVKEAQRLMAEHLLRGSSLTDDAIRALTVGRPDLIAG